MRKKIIIFASCTVAAAILLVFIFAQNSLFIHKSKKSPQPPSTEALKSLPYLTWVSAEKNIQKSGVTQYNRKRSFNGINIYNSRNLSEAYLMDMSGNILHTWSAKTNPNESWQHVEVCKNGDLLAVVKDKMLIRMDWNSRIKWIKKMRFHHDVAIAKNKNIYALTREDDLIYFFGLPIPILNDYIVVMFPDGEIKKKISLISALKEEISPDRFIEIIRWINNPETQEEMANRKKQYNFVFKNRDPVDILHTNTIEIIDKNIKGLCKKGDMLISVLALDLICILNFENEKIVWKWGKENLIMQHHPTLLKNGNILIFDNGGKRRYSRIVELNPLKREIVWEYKSHPPEKFFSITRGASQRLPNGNTLITESDKGHVFEVTSSGKVVWEFYNPEIDKKEKKRGAIYRMMRFPKNSDLFLKRLK